MNPRLKALLALLGSLLAFLFGTSVSDNGTTHTTIAPATTVATPPAVIATDGADKDAKADDPVVVTPKAADVAQNLELGAANGTNDLAPKEAPGLPPLSGPVTGPVAKLLPPYASDSVPGCKTRFLTTNWSYRAPGAQVLAFELHFTAGPDIPNSRADVDGLTTFGSQPSSRVSWHLNIDKDGNCDYNVPFRYKAWTIADLNSETINVETAGKGEAPYLRPGGYQELARIFLAIHKAYPAIELRLAAFKDCHVIFSGIGTHWMGGPCSGGHTDIHPLDVVAVIATLKKYVAAISCDSACKYAKRATELRDKHRRTHQRFVKNDCSRRGPNGQARHGYCDTLRNRNKAVHIAARREHVSLAGTYK